MPNTRSWELVDGPVETDPGDRDAAVYRFTIHRADGERTVDVVFSRTLRASEPTALATPLDAVVASKGEWLVREAISRNRIPRTYTVHTEGWWDDYDDETESHG